jgi:hypothetical protein
VARYPGEPALAEALERSQQEVRARERERAIEAIGKTVAQRTDAHDFERALRVLDEGLSWR